MKRIIKAGTTSNILHIFISDTSSTTGAGLAGLTNASAGLSAYYIRPGATAATAITLAAITTLGTFVSGGFKEIDATNMPGWYEFDPPDAAITTGAVSCSIHLKGAANMAPLPIEVQLDVNTGADIYGVVTNVTYGLSALNTTLGTPAGASVSADIATGNGLLTNSNYGLAKLVRAATPANTLAIDLNGEVNINQAQSLAPGTGVPTTVGGLFYFLRKVWWNKRNFNKNTNVMINYEDDGVTALMTQTITDNASNSTRGAAT